MKIYTRKGDKGDTSLFGGTRVSKNHIRIEAYGTVDELNSHMGVLHSFCKENEIRDFISASQSRLFDIGSHLASDGKADEYLPELDRQWVTELEENMDRYTESLPELKSFIMPRGNTRIAQTHVCRTVCRRAERRVISLAEQEEVADLIPVYLNRLSDYFFVLARYLGHLDGIDETKWSSK